MSTNNWIDDVEDSNEEDEDSLSLFEENFVKMVEDGEVEAMDVSTLEDQVQRIDTPSVLEDAIEESDNDTAIDIFEDRLDEIDDTDDAMEVGDDGEQEETEETVESEGSEEDGDEAVGDQDGGDLTDDEDEDEEVDVDDPDDVSVEDLLEEPEGSESEQEDAEEDAAEEDPEDPDEDDASESGADGAEEDASDLPDVDVESLAPNATTRSAAASQEPRRTLLVWGPEGSGKSHVAHSAPGPIAYIDTEGKADELADKFDGKEIFYWYAEDYAEAKEALDEALDLLGAYLEQGVRGTVVVDSMTKMWEYAKVDYAEYAYQTDDLSEVNFQSELEGEKDWTKIKARHNDRFRQVILDSDFHVVFTSGQKEDYNAVFEGGGKKWVPDGEKWNKYAVKDVVRLRRDEEGRTVADLRKAAKTRYSFMGLEWPEFDDIYEAIDQIYEAEQAEQAIDLDDWPFDVVDGQPVQGSPEGSDGGEEDGE